jgi:hypothetical protein
MLDTITTLNNGLSSKDPRICGYCAKTIADMMRGNWDDEQHTSALLNMIFSSPDSANK